MVTSTFAHPYATQVLSLWLSFLPFLAMGALMIGAILRGNRSISPKGGLRVSIHHR